MATTQTQSYDSSFDTVLHKRSDLHMLRKIWHIGVGTLCLITVMRSSQPMVYWAQIILGIALAGFTFDFLRKKMPGMNKVVLKFMGPLMRRSEREGMSGLPFYALGCSISLFFFQRDIALMSCMFLIYADPISSFFGVLYGKDKLLPNKSLQGAVAGFFTCYLICLFYLVNTATIGTHLLIFAIVSGLIGALSELISAFNIDDNLTIPVLSGLGMTLLNHFIVVYQ